MNQRSLKSTTACEFNVSSNSSNGVVQVESECPLLLGDQRDHLSVDHNHHYKTPQSSQHHHRNQYQSPNQISPSSSTLSSSNSSNSFSSSNSSSNSSLSSPPPSTQPPLLSANFHHSHQLYSNSHASLHQQSKYRLFSTQQPSQTTSHHQNKHQQQTHLPQQLSQQQGKLNFQRSSFETLSESFNRRLICFGYHQQPPPQHNHRHKHHFHHHLQHQNHHYLQQQNKAKCDHLHQVKSHGYQNNNTSSFKDDQEIIRSYIQPPPNKTVFNCCCDYLNFDSNSGKFS